MGMVKLESQEDETVNMSRLQSCDKVFVNIE